ncbi:unnamed protein product, partial [Prorocentrum cordatum]
MTAPVNLFEVGARLAELWLLRGHACPPCSCPPCPAQTCSLTCSGPASSHSEPCSASEAPGGPGWSSEWLAAAAGAGLGWLAARCWPPAVTLAVAFAAEVPPVPDRAAPQPPPVATGGPVTPSQLTLDLAEPQVLINFPDDAAGLRWHHRLLLIQTPTPGVWIASTPDYSVHRLDLNVHRVVALARNGPFLAAQWHESYVFDNPIPAVDHTRIRQQAGSLALVLGQVGPAPAAPPGAAGVWRVADPSHRAFGDEIPAQVLSDPAAFITPDAAGDEDYLCGLVMIDGCWTFCQLVADSDKDAWERVLISDHRKDARVAGDSRDPLTGQRLSSFVDSLALQYAASDPPFPLGGQRVAHEYMRTLRATGMEGVTPHLDFVHKSDISPNSNITRASRRLTDAPHAFQQQDMLNLPSLVGIEVLVRYLAQIEMAVACNHRSPDFQDLDAVVASTVNEHGGLVLPEYTKYIAQIQKALMALNDLGAPLAAARRLASALPANAAQAFVLQRVHQRAAAFGEPLGEDVHRLKILDSGIRPLPIRSLVPGSLLPLIDHPEKYLYRSQAVLGAMTEAGELLAPVHPFWDVNLRRDPKLRLDLFKKLIRIGLVGVRTRCRVRASIFFVDKKDGSRTRMVIDGREPSAMHRRPPRTELGSSAAPSGLCFDADTLADGDSGYHGASADLRQGFYQMQWLEVGSWFCFDFPMAIKNFDLDSVYDEASRSYVHVDRDTVVYPCFQGPAMGWSMVLSIPAGAARIVSERAPCARLGRGELAGASYVDNANVAGSPRELVDAALRAILREFERRGLSFHEVCYATQDFVCRGVRFDFLLGRAVPQRDQAWRLRRAVTALIDRRGCTATAMEVILGHVEKKHFMLMRPALAILSSLYRVAYSDCDYCKFDVEQLRELGLVKALIPLAGVDLGAPWHPWACCSDASMWGHALATSKFEPDELRDIGAYRERWRFLALDRCSDDPRGLPGAECSTLASYAAGASDDAAFAGPGPWQLVVRGALRFLFGAPARVPEGRATLLGLRRATPPVAAHGCRAPSIGDNLSSMMAFEKGRCANPVLRQLACQAAARQLATGIQHYHRYSESKRNPTDYDSRAADRFELAPGQTQRGAARDLGVTISLPPTPQAPPAGPVAAVGTGELPCSPGPPAGHGVGPRLLSGWPRTRARARCILELYAGCTRLAAACLDEGLQAWVPVDISRGSWRDLTDKNVIG